MAEAGPREMAARLRPAERRALLWLPQDGSERRFAERSMLSALIRLRDHGLCATRLVVPGYEMVWRATGLGLSLRAALPQEGEAEEEEGPVSGPAHHLARA